MVSAGITAGVKYCGGCNPRFDRGGFFARLQDRFQDKISFEAVRPEKRYDFLLVISGCTSNCADYTGLNYTKDIIFVTNEQSFEQVVEKLKEYL